MTNTASQSFGWEVAGGKKSNGKKPEFKPKVKKDVPKIEHAPPIKTDATIYDLIRESGDESGDEINNNKKVKQVKPVEAKQAEVKVESPKKLTRQKEPKESLNLVNSSIAANKPKKVQPTVKNPESELDTALKGIKLEDLEKELDQLQALFPNNNLVINQNLIAFLNKQLEAIGDLDPTHENESVYPMAKLDKSVLKFLNTNLSKLNKTDAEKLFDYFLNALFLDNQKVPSNHGHKIGFQLIAKLNQNLLVNLQKSNEVLNANKHRHQRLLISLWALGQFGYYNLSNGLKIWFNVMLPQLNTKGCSSYVVTYLHSLFQFHKVDAKSKTDISLSLDEYTRLNDLVNDNKALNLSKEASQKLKASFDVVRSFYLQEVVKDSQNFENLLKNLPGEKSAKQADLMEFLVESLLKNKDSISKWKQLYSKYLVQSQLLLEEIYANHMRSFKQLKDTRDTMKFFDEHSTNLLSKLNPQAAKETQKSNHFSRTKSKHSETDVLKKFNKLAKKINNEHYTKGSIGSMVLKGLFYTVLAASLFFYWDVNHNKSIYTNSAKLQLEKYGLLDHTLRLIESVQRLLLSIKKTVNYYVPIWQKKFNDNVVPVVQNAWKTTKVYVNLVVVKLEPYKKQLVVYTDQAAYYVKTNFPVLVKNLESCIQLTVNYVTTVGNFVFYYISEFAEFVGVKLFGLKNGELSKVFLDAFKFALDKLAVFFQVITEYFNKL